MRILVVRPGPSFSVQDVCNGWVKALGDLGHQVADFNFDDRLTFYEQAHHHDGDTCVKSLDTVGAVRLANKGLEAACYEFWPDVIVVVSGFYVRPDLYWLWRDRGHKVVLLHTESPYEDDRQAERAARVDLNVLNDPTNIDRFPPGTLYLPHAYDPDIHCPYGLVAEPSDVFLVGTGYPSRVKFLEQVDWSGLTLRLAGNWNMVPDDSPLRTHLIHPPDHCLPNRDAVAWYRAAASSLNLYRRETTEGGTADGWAMGPREVELAATGCFYLTEPRGENRQVLPMVPTFTGPDDYAEQLRWWLAHPAEREQVTREARAAIADRTFVNNARRMLDAL